MDCENAVSIFLLFFSFLQNPATVWYVQMNHSYEPELSQPRAGGVSRQPEPPCYTYAPRRDLRSSLRRLACRRT